MKKILLLLVVLGLTMPVQTFARKKNPKKAVADSTALSKLKGGDWNKAVKDAKVLHGLFTVYYKVKEGKLLFELADSCFKRDYILSNRVAQTSNTHDYVAGQMVKSPILIRFSCDSNKVLMHQIQSQNVVKKGDPIAASFKTNFTNPVLKGFKIVARKKERMLIDVTSFFGGNEKLLSPIKPDNPLSVIMGGSKSLKGTFVADASGISSVKDFPQNIEIKTLMTFSLTPLNDPYTVTMHRSLYLAPEDMMKPRIHDNRVGYFMTDKKVYSSSSDKIDELSYIHRWRLEPKDEDIDKYFAGELVEPKKPIVFYVDSAFPEKWRSTVKQGIMDWNKAFEAAGFKNAIIAKDYPKNDPDFDPDDMRYSCIKYAVTPTANAMGPSYVDPRTGEILTADVIWYHNVVSLLHNWRFAQTGAVDKRTHKKTFDDDLMKESMRYVTSHEVGHTLGLMHNMGASYSFPVDSLRSPSFTQKYGTTPSIMDYARNNYVAQPGDLERGVKLTPPILGIEDINAIKWGYTIIKGAETPEDEKKTLTQWIDEKKNDPRYEFGAQQVFGTIDVSDQTEDLGNDHMKAGNYAISNLKIIMRNLEKWTAERGENYDYMKSIYKSVVNQYHRHLNHVLPYFGGVIYHEVRQGDNIPPIEYLDKATQKRALHWVVNQLRTYKSWLVPQNLLQKFDRADEISTDFTANSIASIYSSTALQRISDGYKSNPRKNYSLNQYIQDAWTEIFKPTIQGRALSEDDITIENQAIKFFIQSSGLQTPKTSTSTKLPLLTENEDVDEEKLPCEYFDPTTSFIRINYGIPALKEEFYKPIMLQQLKKVLQLFRSRRTTGNVAARNFYDYQITVINKLLNK
ncbi:MAG: zinc-dependent metalloprotease [Prevotella sp.]|jgi:hypothetical protein